MNLGKLLLETLQPGERITFSVDREHAHAVQVHLSQDDMHQTFYVPLHVIDDWDIVLAEVQRFLMVCRIRRHKIERAGAEMRARVIREMREAGEIRVVEG